MIIGEYTVSTYGEMIADQFDALCPHVGPNLIDSLYDLSRNGKVLELGIGTGRIALPLSERGVEMHGIDPSPAMVEKLKLKDKNGSIQVHIGNFAEFEMTEKFDLIFVVCNTFFGLLTQQDQISCFIYAEKALKPKGTFLIEAFVPDLARFDRGQTVRTSDVSTEQVRFDCSKHDIATQTIVSQIVIIQEKGIKLYPVNIRYAWPSESDIMAELAGLRLSERWGGWDKRSYTSASASHISVYKRLEVPNLRLVWDRRGPQPHNLGVKTMGQNPDNVAKVYDAVAMEYAEKFCGEHEKKPRDREILYRFSQAVAEKKPIWDFGCGPGQTTQYLRDLGMEISGLDLSEKLVEQAIIAHPGINFRKGNILDLEFGNESIAGIVAFYAIVHFSKEQVGIVFREIFRVLQPGGIFLFTYHIGEDPIHLEEFLDKVVEIDFIFFKTDFIFTCIKEAGFCDIEIIERDPYPEVEYQSRRAYVFAKKPTANRGP